MVVIFSKLFASIYNKVKCFLVQIFPSKYGGGVREDVALGDVTVGKIYNVLPFKNTFVAFADLTMLKLKQHSKMRSTE